MFLAAGKSSAEITLALEREAVTLHAKDIEINRSISAYGAAAIIAQNPGHIEEILHDEVGKVFGHVLEDAGVFKWDTAG